METSDKANISNITASSESVSMRDMFFAWLNNGHSKKYSPTTILSSIDTVSGYALNKKISSTTIWDISKADLFKPLYSKLLENKFLRITNRNAYGIFIVAGKLYLKFLKEQPWITDTITESETVDSGDQSTSYINPDDVVAWLVTQPNANGTLYLESVVKQYMSVLRSAPSKLVLSESFDNDSVFTCHSPNDLNIYWDICKAAPNYKQVNSHTSGMFSAGMNCLLRYLEFLTSTESPKAINVTMQQNENIELWNNEIGRDFHAWLMDFANYSQRTAMNYTNAVSRCIRDFCDLVEIVSSNPNSHADNLRKFTTLLYEDTAFITMNTKGHNLYSAALAAFERFIVSKDSGVILNKEKAMASEKDDKERLATIKIDALLVEKLTNILASRFSNGYRLSSPIEMTRFRSFAAKDLNGELKLSDEELKSHIAACGTVYEGKVYAVSADTKKRIKELAERYFADGAQAIFFAAFYTKNEDWLFDASVVSGEMLTDILRRLFPRLSFTQTYFGYTNASVFATLEKEILRVWDGDILLTYDKIAERLPYVPLERIKYVLGQNGDFIWNSVETFSHISRIVINDDEHEAVRTAAMQKCNVCGYVSITDLPFGEIEERNYELSITAIHNAVYRICLSDKFDKKGKIVTRKGDVFDALTIMKEHCRTIDKCSLDNLLSYEKELTGEVHRWIPMEAGNTILVRIDKENYVADKFVHFDSNLIDDAIELALKGDYLPLKSFTTFGAFPDCGQTWNLFLLESYCRRFSQSFRFDAPSVNSRNVGAVIRKSCTMDYTQVMTDAVANTDILLTEANVSRFLCDSGYIGRSTTARAPEIIDKAIAERERRN